MAKVKTPTNRGSNDAASNDRDRLGSNPDRQGRGYSDHERTNEDGTAMTAAEREAMLRNEFAQEALPKAPKIPGWHACWLSTTSAYDPIHKRIRIGYVPVKASEVVGLEQFNVKEGEWAGHVSCNEMVLFKIREDTYQSIMKLFHHTMPMEEEARIKEMVRSGPSGTDKQTDLDIDEGFQDLAKPVIAPRQFQDE